MDTPILKFNILLIISVQWILIISQTKWELVKEKAESIVLWYNKDTMDFLMVKDDQET